jgi:CRP/FNR family cyclic AMP-dependent transcriptional regulator
MSEIRREQVRRTFAAHPVFDVLDPAPRDALFSYGVTKRYGTGETIFERGDAGDSMMLVLSGRVRIGNVQPNGKEAIICFVEPGDLLGEVALLDGKPRSADAVAIEPSELFVLYRRELSSVLRANPAVTVRLVEVLCERLRRLTTMHEEVMCLESRPRIARAVLRLAEEHGKPCARGVAISLRISQHVLAGCVGLSREVVNRQLGEWRQDGLIETPTGGILILQPLRLQAVADL